MPIAITDAIKTLAEAERRFGLGRSEDAAFFPEWRSDLPELTAAETMDLGELRRRYLYQRSEGQLLEGTVTLLMVAPLLTAAGFYDPPFRVRAEESVQLDLGDREEVLQGRIDVLVVLDQLWVVVLESKKTALSVWAALPQTLAYLMTNPRSDRPSFAIVTNGDEIFFVKLGMALGQAERYYAVSRVFSPFVSGDELCGALQVLKVMGKVAIETIELRE
jgi:hypothetical protein